MVFDRNSVFNLKSEFMDYVSSQICYQWRVSGNVHNKPVVTCYQVTNAMHNDDGDQAWDLCSAPAHHCTRLLSPVIVSCCIHTVALKSVKIVLVNKYTTAEI